MFTIAKSWYELLKDEFNKSYYQELTSFLNHEYSIAKVYPEPKNVYCALNLVKYENVKVVIIGQDPYHQPRQAHGLCFSVQKGVEIPRSLQNIYKELNSDCGCTISKSGDLTKWAKQGVLLLNSVLTVRQNMPNSHKEKGWEKLVAKVIELLNKRDDPVIFLLWGNNAKKMAESIDENKHYILTASHPSPLSASNGFFGCKHFSKANEILKSLNKEPIDWQID